VDGWVLSAHGGNVVGGDAMTGRDYILAKQTAWARNHGKTLIGSRGERGRPAYTTSLEENLFQPLLPETRAEFEAGDGGELVGHPPKMAAVHSSSALGVNIFQYWQAVGDVPTIAAACGWCERRSPRPCGIRFEQKMAISATFTHAPNVDVVIETGGRSPIKAYGIECKFSEAYSSRQHAGLDPKYLALTGIWEGLPATRHLAETIDSSDTHFRHLHAAQLMKHVLGLKSRYGAQGFRLLYLWYDVLGKEGADHRAEVEEFGLIISQDGVPFRAMTFQELIAELSDQAREGHRAYIEYMSNRYL
jgi:hypothetical protein